MAWLWSFSLLLDAGRSMSHLAALYDSALPLPPPFPPFHLIIFFPFRLLAAYHPKPGHCVPVVGWHGVQQPVAGAGHGPLHRRTRYVPVPCCLVEECSASLTLQTSFWAVAGWGGGKGGGEGGGLESENPETTIFFRPYSRTTHQPSCIYIISRCFFFFSFL